MKNIELRALVIITLVVLALSSVAVPSKYSQGIYASDKYAMPEPFSSGPLLTYSSLESTAGDS